MNRIELERLDGEIAWVAADQIGPIMTGKKKTKGGDEESTLAVVLMPGNITWQLRNETPGSLLKKLESAYGRRVNVYGAKGAVA